MARSTSLAGEGRVADDVGEQFERRRSRLALGTSSDSVVRSGESAAADLRAEPLLRLGDGDANRDVGVPSSISAERQLLGAELVRDIGGDARVEADHRRG